MTIQVTGNGMFMDHLVYDTNSASKNKQKTIKQNLAIGQQ